jgi:hypothetical protein
VAGRVPPPLGDFKKLYTFDGGVCLLAAIRRPRRQVRSRWEALGGSGRASTRLRQGRKTSRIGSRSTPASYPISRTWATSSTAGRGAEGRGYERPDNPAKKNCSDSESPDGLSAV